MESGLARTSVSAFTLNHAVFVAETLIVALTTYILARYLAPELYGIYTSVMAIATSAILLINFGYEPALSVHIPIIRKEIKKVRFLLREMYMRRLLWVIIFIIVILFFMLVDIATLSPALKSIENYLPLALIFALINLNASILARFLISMFRVKQLAIVKISRLLLILVLCWFFLSKGFGIDLILWIYVIVAMGQFIAHILQCRHYLLGTIKKFSTDPIFRFGRTAWYSDIIGYILGKNSDIVMLMVFGISNPEIALYQISFIVIDYARKFSTSGMAGVAQSSFSSAYESGGKERLSTWWRIFLKFNLLVTTPGVLFLVIYAKPILSWILPNYTAASVMIQVYGGLILAATTLGTTVHITAFYAIGMADLVFRFMLIGGIINVLLNLALIPIYGVLGALIATGLTAILVGVVSLVMIRRTLRCTYPFSFFCKCICCLGTAAVISFFLPSNSVIMILLKGLSFLVVYIIMARIIKILEYDDVLRAYSVSKSLGKLLTPFSKCRKPNLHSSI